MVDIKKKKKEETAGQKYNVRNKLRICYAGQP